MYKDTKLKSQKLNKFLKLNNKKGDKVFLLKKVITLQIKQILKC